MPNTIVKAMAKKANKNTKEVEKLWTDAVEIASEELGKEKKDFSDKEWAYTTGILKKMLKIKENIMKSRKEMKTFFESSMKANDYLEACMDYPGYDEEYIDEEYIDEEDYMMDEEEEEYSDTYYDEYGNRVNIEFEVEHEGDIEETMVSGSFTSPKGPITGPINHKDNY